MPTQGQFGWDRRCQVPTDQPAEPLYLRLVGPSQHPKWGLVSQVEVCQARADKSGVDLVSASPPAVVAASARSLLTLRG